MNHLKSDAYMRRERRAAMYGVLCLPLLPLFVLVRLIKWIASQSSRA